MQNSESIRLKDQKKTKQRNRIEPGEIPISHISDSRSFSMNNSQPASRDDLFLEGPSVSENIGTHQQADLTHWRKHELPDGSGLGDLITNLHEGSSLKKWIPYENCNYELPVSHWTPLGFYRCRYATQKLLHKSLFRVFNTEITIGGLLFFAILVALSVIGGYYSYITNRAAKSTGVIASIAGAVLFAFTGRNSIWIFLTGVSYERIIVWHKLMGWSVIALGISHAVIATDSKGGRLDTSGMILICAFGAAILISFILKLFTYYFFLLFHRAIIIVIIVFTIAHEAPLILIGIGYWVFDLLLRAIVYLMNRSNSQNVSAKKISDSIVELSFPKRNFKYRSGQYAFLTIPEISLWEPHPFSFSSSPHDEYVVFHIKVLGNWTQKLNELSTQPNKQFSIFIDGPYGSPSIDIETPNKSIFLLIGGGIGVTPMRSIANDLLNQAARGRKIDKIIFYWAVRDVATIKSIITKHEWLSKFNKHFRKADKSKVLQRKIHLTREDENLKHLPQFIERSFAESVFQEKLELQKAFTELKQNISKDQTSQVGVLCCGPSIMIDQASSLSKKNGFEFHGEVFEL